MIYFLKHTIRHGGKGTKNVPRDPGRWTETTEEAHIHGKLANMAAASSCTVLTDRDAEGGETRRGVARNAEKSRGLIGALVQTIFSKKSN